jgi:F420-non-reducing hydrogenase large subunit
VGLIHAAPDVAKKALRVRTIGNRLMEITGGRGTHPVAAVGGGMAAALDKEKGETLRRLAEEGLGLGQELFPVAKKALTDNLELVRSIDQQTHYLATVNDGALDHYQGALRLRAPDGVDHEFDEDAWTEHLSEETTATSYSKFVFCATPGGERVPYRVGPLARLNCCDRIDTPLANAELEAFRELGGHPCHLTFMYHYARLIELLHGLEKLAELVQDDELYSPEVRVKTDGTPRSATSHVEAMRGTLFHDYKVDANGVIEKANLIVATQQNTSAINESIGLVAQAFLDRPDDYLLNAVEMSIRCYDPCLSCATHRIGEMKLDLVVRHQDEIVRRVRR